MYIFQNFSAVACSRTPLELFLFLNQLQICSAEKNTPKQKCGNYDPSLLKFLATPLAGLLYSAIFPKKEVRNK